MSWFHNSQLREWVHGCVTASITQMPHAPSPLSALSPAAPSSSKMLAAAAATSAVSPPPRSTTHVVVEQAKVVIEVSSSCRSRYRQAVHEHACASFSLTPRQVGADELLLRHVQPHIKGASIAGVAASSSPTQLPSKPQSSSLRALKGRSPSTPTRASAAALSVGGRSSRSLSAVARRPQAGEWEGMEQRVHRTLAQR